MSFRQGKRRDVTKFKLTEISPVDVPAQEGADAAIIKGADIYAADGTIKSKGGKLPLKKTAPGSKLPLKKTLPVGGKKTVTDEELDDLEAKSKDKKLRKGSFRDEDETPGVITSAEDGHTHIVWLHGRIGTTTWQKSEGEESGHDHPWMLNSDGTITIGQAEGHSHTVDQSLLIELLLMSSLDKVADPTAGTPGITKEADMAEKDATQVAEETEAITKRAERAEAIVALTPDQRTHFNGLDETAQATYLGKSSDERNSDIAKAGEADPIVYTSTDGSVFRKSCDPVNLSLVKRVDAQDVELAKARVREANSGFAKRAGEELANLPGEVSTKIAILKAIDTIEDEAVRKSATESILAGDKAIQAAFHKVGTRETITGDATAEGQLDTLAKARQVDTPGLSQVDAYDQVCAENPELLAAAVGTTRVGN